MVGQRKSPHQFSIEELDRELIARGAQIPGEERFKSKDVKGTYEMDAVMSQIKELYRNAPPPAKTLSHISTWELIKTLKAKTSMKKDSRGIWHEDDRVDFYEIQDEQIRKNANCVAAICKKSCLIDEKNGFSTIRVKTYGEIFNLCSCEPFHNQPAASGPMSSGFLVKEDLIVTAGHCVQKDNVEDLRFVFGYKMLGAATAVAKVPNANIYRGIEIIRRVYDRNGNGADWVMVKLDRKVEGQSAVKLSEKDVSRRQSVYVIGHPVGLPLKYGAGACVRDIDDAYFAADLNIYSGNSGSPVFDSDTHEVVGIVVRGDNRDFRWLGTCWQSVIYPNPGIKSQGAQCTRVSEFIGYC